MKKIQSKKSFDKFKKRNTHKRVSKQRSRDALLDQLRASGLDYSDFKLRDAVDRGRGGRACAHQHRDDERVRGIYRGSRSGFGFVTPFDAVLERDIFIPEDKTLGAIDSDTVECIYHVYRDRMGQEKTEGRIVKIIEQTRRTVIGTLEFKPGYRIGRRSFPPVWTLTPDDPKLSLRITVTDRGGGEDGDKVVATLDRSSFRGGCIEAGVSAVLGDTLSKEANYGAILLDSGIPVDFTPEELRMAEELAARPISTEGRRDLRDEVIFTMDSSSAKDLDDAVSLRRTNSGWLLSVHIADVSYYIPKKSALERMAMQRGTSVYFTDKVVPMLPHCLSSGACSLSAGDDRYAISAHISLCADGEIRGVKIEPAVIRSRIKGVYEEINRLLDGDEDRELRAKYRAVMPSLLRMQELYLVLLRRSENRGALEMEIPEAQIILDGEGRVCDIRRRSRGVSERIIEQFMLIANEAVATHLTERGVPCVYRVHEPPPEDKLDSFLEMAHNMGFDTSVISRADLSPKALGNLLALAEKRGLAERLGYSLLRAMSKATYSAELHGHFGLGLQCYCHFTSPIRRLSDLATHRIIRDVLFEGKSPAAYRSYAKRCAVAATDTEQRAVSAERRIEDLYKVLYMSDKLGECFEGTVSSVTSFGIFVTLDNTVEGLVPSSEFFGAYILDEKNLSVRVGGEIYRLGQRVRVRLEQADIIRGKLAFSLE